MGINGQASSQRHVVLAALMLDETCEPALLEAARIVELTAGAELHALHVVEENEENRELISIDIRLTGAPNEIRRRVEQMWVRYRCDVIVHIRVGRPAIQILQLATDLRADMLVVGTHRRAGLKKLVLGSVGETVLQHAPCPVLVAVAKDERGSLRPEGVEPACPECVGVRPGALAGEHTYWCSRHTGAYAQELVYETHNHGLRPLRSRV
jgi:nucleotide-binding universal stress UspA family protein